LSLLAQRTKRFLIKHCATKTIRGANGKSRLAGGDLTGCFAVLRQGTLTVPLDTTFDGLCCGRSVLASRLFTEVTRLNRSPNSLIAHRLK
jgi:hypothetical protein